jgi:hypothetical protein
MMSDETFNPSPDEWYSATLYETFPRKGYIVAQLSNGELVFVSEKVLTFGGPGKHCYCLPLGTTMSVRIEPQSGSKYPYKAAEAQIEADVKAPTIREEVTITSWRQKFGGARRSCGCGLFIWFNSRHDEADFQPGDTITVDVSFSNKRGDFLGNVVLETT